MRQLIDALKEIKRKNVDIYTEHKFFDKQHIQMKFVPETEAGCGSVYMDRQYTQIKMMLFRMRLMMEGLQSTEVG